MSNASTLMWLTGIERALDKQDLVEARKTTDLAIDANVGVLSSLDARPYLNFIAFNSPWSAANDISVANSLLAKTNRYFVHRSDWIRPETQTYLAQYTNAETRAEIDLKFLSSKLRMYRALNGELPTTEQGLDALVHRPSPGLDTWHQLVQQLPLDPWKHAYQYRVMPARPSGYELFSLGQTEPRAPTTFISPRTGHPSVVPGESRLGWRNAIYYRG